MTKGEETRQKIVNEAVALINQKGYGATSMGDLMEATGLTKGGLYRHFPGKESIALAAFDHYLERIRVRLGKALGGCETPRELLVAAIHSFGTIAHEPEVRGGCLVGNLALEADYAYPQLRERVKDAFDQWRALFEGWLTTMTDPEESGRRASLMISLMQGALMQSNLYHDTTHADLALQACLELVP